MPVLAAESFKDVPKDHWAAGAVEKVAEEGIMKGYPNQTFKGDKPITRYELAAALVNMVEFMQQSKKPLVPSGKESSSIGKNWGDQAMSFLRKGGYLPANSPLLTDGSKQVTGPQLAQALASVAAKLIEKQVPPDKDSFKNQAVPAAPSAQPSPVSAQNKS